MISPRHQILTAATRAQVSPGMMDTSGMTLARVCCGRGHASFAWLVNHRPMMNLGPPCPESTGVPTDPPSVWWRMSVSRGVVVHSPRVQVGPNTHCEKALFLQDPVEDCFLHRRRAPTASLRKGTIPRHMPRPSLVSPSWTGQGVVPLRGAATEGGMSPLG
jgi:hypothetical protein